VRFSRWDDILAQPIPDKDLRFTTGMWHYVRALAFNARNQPDSAAAERDQLAAIAKAIPAEQMVNLNSASKLFAIAQAHLAGEMAAQQGHIDQAVDQLELAVKLEDELTYDEPPAWYMPMRQRLGAILLTAGRQKEAEKVFRDDLARRPENGWSLHGLAESLKAQGRTREAQKVAERFSKAWSKADVQLTPL
jgi:tetratricopeptide (TPR) repeat protein